MSEAVFALVGALLFAWGLFGLFAYRHLIRRIIAAKIATSAVFLLIIALARVPGQGVTDPVPQALVLTGIVISISLAAFALVLACRFIELTGESDLDEDGRG
ncbi:hypothetical protein CAI21_03400 [Alkalilimnicola ehrlichii]|uniref:Multisubunit sodium/proton antiporter, MrpC subunit n=1 Tax=Alkalilimnicola ehrlichii TaxID=351052 RepID=A0A3E0X0M8_9GAMM|nr:NADH-quinone oxidoreductase subunit K [Alkalilimnicola ehrlichii]RFA31031.1 hypothetical protein CAI21_03400 [Alkalilimnicola ehrlichii]RFA38984.1 hypothetical protein CAL65_03550 [Alkalilimnicola ehrlichii]